MYIKYYLITHSLHCVNTTNLFIVAEALGAAVEPRAAAGFVRVADEPAVTVLAALLEALVRQGCTWKSGPHRFAPIGRSSMIERGTSPGRLDTRAGKPRRPGIGRQRRLALGRSPT